MPDTTLERRLQAARPEVDDAELRLEAMVASRLFGPAHARPARIGRFTLLEHVGRGGMGDVYAAYDPVLDRKVALKILRPGSGLDRLDADERGWLLREARAAARLAHPNVVSIHEVGEVDDSGGVYVAMEFIDGVTLRAWLNERRSLAQILHVFVHAGRGLAAAHDAGVVHRDFKPENVLICRGDGVEPRGRVVDFGLARVTGRRPSSEAAGEAGGRSTLMGTPAYMSPEQILRRPLDARTDQFSFCVALHEALTGRHPFGADEPGVTGEQVLARILVGGHSRGERPIPGWLRGVLRRGLMPDPSARYPSMHALVRELQATPARRKRRALLGAGVALALASSAITMAGIDGSTSAPCVDVADDLRDVWDERIRAASQAAFAASGLVDAGEVWRRLEPRIDDYAGAWRAARYQTCRALHDAAGPADAVLRLREVCLLRRRAELAGLTALLVEADATTIGAAITALDQLTPLVACDDTESLRREIVSSDPSAGLVAHESMRRELLDLRTRLQAGHAQEVRPRAVALVEAARERQSPTLLAEALHLRGLTEEALGHYDAAAASLEAAVYEAIAGRHERLHAELAVHLVWLHGIQRREPGRASVWIEHAEAALRAIHDDPPVRASLLHHRGVLANSVHDYVTAERLLREAIALRAGSSPHARVELALSMSNLGHSLLSQGKVEEAEPQIAAALDRYRDLFGPHHPTVAAILSNLGQAHVNAGRTDRGLEMLREALALKERALGRDHVALLTTLTNLGSAYSGLGRSAEARAHYLRALVIGERALGPDSPHLEGIFHNLAFEAWTAGDHDGVLRDATRALELQRRVYGEENPILAPTLELLARSQLELGRVDEAVATIERALAQASRGALEPVVRGSVLLSAAWIRRHTGAAPALVRALADQAEQLLRPAPGPSPEQERELAALRSP